MEQRIRALESQLRQEDAAPAAAAPPAQEKPTQDRKDADKSEARSSKAHSPATDAAQPDRATPRAEGYQTGPTNAPNSIIGLTESPGHRPQHREA
jgi:hypothetical protein